MSDKQFPACFGCGVGFDQKNLIYEHLPGCTFNPKGHACTWMNCKSCRQHQAEEQARMKRWFRAELLEAAPCLIDGHTADLAVQWTFKPDCPDPYRLDRHDHPRRIDLKLCARCGVVYEEKSK